MFDELLGSWDLVSCEARWSDGTVTYPYGKDALGLLIYTRPALMSVHLMSRGRAKLNCEDPLNTPADAAKAALDGASCYFARVEVDTAKKVVHHHVIGCTFPNWEGIDNARLYDIQGDTLSLLRETPRMTKDGRTVQAALVWKRIAGSR